MVRPRGFEPLTFCSGVLAVKGYIVDSWRGLGWFPSRIRVSPALIAQHNEQRLFVPRVFRKRDLQTCEANHLIPDGRHQGSDDFTDAKVVPC
jgi:hypothetical protein